MNPSWLLALAPALLAASFAPPAPAQESPGSGDDVGNVRRKIEGPDPSASGAEESGRWFSLEVNVEAKTAYLFRGYNVMDTGYILQPEVTMSPRPAEWGSYSFSPYAGVWNNVSEEKGPDESIWAHWTELDVTGGVVVERGDWSLDVQFNFYSSPSDFFGRTNELGAILTYGGEVLGVELQPHVTLFQELWDQNDGDENTYFELGLEPEFDGTRNVTVAIPVTLGMSLDSYYTDDEGNNAVLGYGSVGIRPAYQLTENWSVYFGVEYVHLFADSAKFANAGDEGKVIGGVGVSFTY